MRKKFTMLFAALLCCVGVAKADVTDLPQISTVENPVYYTIMNTRSSQPGGLMYWAGDNVGMKDEQTVVLEDKHKFFFTGSHDAMYVHNAATGKKLATIGNGDKAAGSWTDEGTLWAVGVSPKGGGLAFGPKGGLNGGSCWNECNYKTAADKPDFTTYSANDEGSIFIVDKAEDYVFPISDKFYFIEAPLFEKVQGEVGKKAIYVNNEGKAVWGSEDLWNENFYWIPTVKDGKVALKNLGTGTYLSKADGTMTGEIAEATLKILGDCSFNINISGTIHAANHGNGAGTGSNLTGWGGGIGSASAWRFVQKNDPRELEKVVVEYSFRYGDVEKYTQTSNTHVGEKWPAVNNASFPFGVSAEKPVGEVSAEGVEDGVVTKVVELSVDLPFTYAANYESIENWYYLNIRDDGPTYMYYDKDVAFIKATENSVPADSKNAYTWAFIGDPFTGFSIVNYEAGSTMVLSAPEEPNGSQNEKQLARMVIEGGNKTWNFVKPTHANAAAGAFYVQHPTGTSYAFNRQDYKGVKTVCYWTGRDTGSALQVVKRDDYKELTDLVARAEDMGVKTDGVGTFTEETVEKFNAALTAAKSVGAGDFDAIGQATVDLQAAINGLATIQPEADKFYTIVSSCTKDHRAGQEIYVNKDGVMHFARVVDVNYASAIERVFQFVPTNDGKFYLFNIEKGTYMQSVGTATELDVTKAKAVTIKNMGKDNIVSIVPDGQNQMHAQDRNSIIVGWHNDSYNDGSAWTIVETELSLNDLTHTLTVSDAGWATLVLGYNTTIPTGVKAYAVSSIAEGKAVLTEVTEVLPAHTPVLIEAAKGEYAFNYTATEATVASNLLAGSVFNTYVAPVEGTTNYVLSNNNSVVALYKKTKTNADGKIEFGANKAYLPVVTAAEGAPAMFAFGRDAEEGTTGIDQFISNEEVVIYDLAGRRVQKMEKGIYIVNGKKVVIK